MAWQRQETGVIATASTVVALRVRYDRDADQSGNCMSFSRQLLRHKSVEQLQADVGQRRDFRRVLGLWQLTAIGIGGIIGVGIFVLAGQQAAANAGPAVALSFLIA